MCCSVSCVPDAPARASVPFAELQQQVWHGSVARTTVLSHLSRLRTALSCPEVRLVVVGDTCVLHLDRHRDGCRTCRADLRGENERRSPGSQLESGIEMKTAPQEPELLASFLLLTPHPRARAFADGCAMNCHRGPCFLGV